MGIRGTMHPLNPNDIMEESFLQKLGDPYKSSNFFGVFDANFHLKSCKHSVDSNFIPKRPKFLKI